MTYSFTSATAYGSLMLMGEHSVLHGAKAVVGATSQSLRASITPRDDRRITIQSNLGHYATQLDHIVPNHTFRFALGSIGYCQKQLPLSRGFDIHYQSTIPTTIGMGSSAATIVATTEACFQLCGEELDKHALWQHSQCIVRQIQGRGSGADLCAAIYGGLCVFNIHDGWTRAIDSPLMSTLYWALHYSGYKTTTDKVLKLTQQLEQQSPDKANAIYCTMATLTEDFITALDNQDPIRLGHSMHAYQQQMVALGVSDTMLDTMVKRLNHHSDIVAAKISGSGLGDCVLSVGTTKAVSILPECPHYHIPF